MSHTYVLLTLLVLYVCHVQGQSQCTTPNGSRGSCIPIKSCQIIIALIRSPKRDNADENFVRSSYCGNDELNQPKVCCPDNVVVEDDRRCFTPDGNVGTCISFDSCPLLQKLLFTQLSDENINFVKNSRCEGPEARSVCCGTEIKKVSQPTINCVPSAAPADPRTECCGLDASNGDRIFGGNVTAIDQYPWLTVIEYIGKKDKKIKLLCGGSLISSLYVLTAGHCVVGPVLDVGIPTNVRVGDYDILNDGPDCVEVAGGGEDCTDGTVILPIEKVIPHKGYDPNSPLRRHDIALLRLQKPAPYNDFIRPICLPTKDITKVESSIMFFTAGWGAVSDTQSFSNVKLEVELPYRSMTDCQPSYDVRGRKVKLWTGQICAGGELGKDSCKGDSGGPLMHDNGRIFTIDGIVSFGPTPCGIENVPGVYTKVYEYLPWIRTHLKP